jgi:predicted HicB family RNase H-like nuclease
MKYKGYFGRVEYDEEAEIFFGRVINIDDVITFESDSAKEIKQAFRDSVDDYLEFCSELGKEPNKPYSGKFIFRTTPELHEQIAIAAAKQDKSINTWIEEVVKQATIKTLAGE